MAQEVDLLMTFHNESTLAVQPLVADTDMPVIFARVFNPVEVGLGESIAQPGGNFTGIQNFNILSQKLEWLVAAVPGTEKVYVPVTADVSEVNIATLTQTAPQRPESRSGNYSGIKKRHLFDRWHSHKNT